MSHKRSKDLQDILILLHDYSVDIESRSIYLLREVDEDLANIMIKNLHFLEKSEGDIKIYINTPGGAWADGMAIFETIRKSKHNVIGYIIGQCSSMGSIILQACDRRIMSKYSSMLIHPGQTGTEGTVQDFITRADFEFTTVKQMLEIYWSKMEKHEGGPLWNGKQLTLKKFKIIFKQDIYLFSKQALGLGLIDVIEE